MWTKACCIVQFACGSMTVLQLFLFKRSGVECQPFINQFQWTGEEVPREHICSKQSKSVKHRNDLPEVSVGSSTADLRMNIHKVCIQRQILASGLCPDGWSLAEMIDSQ